MKSLTSHPHALDHHSRDDPEENPRHLQPDGARKLFERCEDRTLCAFDLLMGMGDGLTRLIQVFDEGRSLASGLGLLGGGGCPGIGCRRGVDDLHHCFGGVTRTIAEGPSHADFIHTSTVYFWQPGGNHGRFTSPKPVPMHPMKRAIRFTKEKRLVCP